MRTLVFSLAVGWLAAAMAIAGEPCKTPPTCSEVQTCGGPGHCARCGCSNACGKQCKIVCEMKEVKKTVWVVKCSEVCTVMPNCGHKCGCPCEACQAGAPCIADGGCANGHDKCDPCAAEKKKNFIPPKCGKVREVKKLEKKEVICKVPSYKCVVEYCCPQCSGQDTAAPANPTKAAAPLPPVKPPVAPSPMPNKTTQETMPALGLAT